MRGLTLSVSLYSRRHLQRGHFNVSFSDHAAAATIRLLVLHTTRHANILRQRATAHSMAKDAGQRHAVSSLAFTKNTPSHLSTLCFDARASSGAISRQAGSASPVGQRAALIR